MTHLDISGYYDFEDFYSMCAKECPLSLPMVEVGCWQGKSVIGLSELCKSFGKSEIQIFAVDTWRGSDDHKTSPSDMALINQSYGHLWHLFIRNVRNCGMQHAIVPMPMPSLEAAKYFDDKSIFMAFIDARHTYEDSKADMDSWFPKIVDGGILAGHDYGWGGMDKVARAVHEKFGDKFNRLGTSVWWVRK